MALGAAWYNGCHLTRRCSCRDLWGVREHGDNLCRKQGAGGEGRNIALQLNDMILAGEPRADFTEVLRSAAGRLEIRKPVVHRDEDPGAQCRADRLNLCILENMVSGVDG